MQAVFHTQKKIRKSFNLNKNPSEDNDSIVADCRFTIEKELEPLNITLNIPLFLSDLSQLLKDKVAKSQGVSSVRLHAERAITRVKKFKV